MQEKASLSVRQVFVLLVSMMLGVGILTIPREVTDKVGTPDSWMSVLLALPAAAIPILIIAKLINVFPNRYFSEFVPLIVGKFGAWVVGLSFASYYILLIGFETRMLGILVRQYLLDKTPMEVLVLPVLFASAYLILGGIQALARINQLFFPILLTVFVVILFLSIQNFELKNVQPILSKGLFPVIKGILSASFSLLGVETLLFFGCFVKNRSGLGKTAIAAAAMIAIITAASVLTALGHFGSKTVITILYPTLEMVKTIEIPGGFAERLESLFMTIWIMALFTTISISHFVSSELLARLMKRKAKSIVIGLLPLFYFTAILPKGLIEVFKLGTIITYWGAGLSLAIPGGLLLLARIRRLGTYAKQ